VAIRQRALRAIHRLHDRACIGVAVNRQPDRAGRANANGAVDVNTAAESARAPIDLLFRSAPSGQVVIPQPIVSNIVRDKRHKNAILHSTMKGGNSWLAENESILY
jgi:hypothetical protein